MKPVIEIDFETRSLVDITTCGAGRYAADPSTRILCVCWAVDGGPVMGQVGEGIPDIFKQAVEEGWEFEAFNAMFEILIWSYRWPSLPLPKFRCTRALAASHGLPQSLDRACRALHIGWSKDIEGQRLIGLYSKPRKDGAFLELKGEDEKKMLRYCAKDVILSRRIAQRLPPLSDGEQEVYEWTAKANLRGMTIDPGLAVKADKIAVELLKRGNEELGRLTHGTIFSVSQIARIKNLLQKEYGITSESLDKEAIEGLLLGKDMPPVARRVLELRRDLSQTSVKKFGRTTSAVCADGKVRDILIYHGAATGRWTSQVVQFQNLPKYQLKDPETALKLIEHGDADLWDMAYKSPMLSLSGCIRGLVVPAKGKKLVVVDYVAIEARVLMWLAGQTDAVEAFREGKDIYIEMAEEIYHTRGMSKATHPKERQLGKQAVLGCLAKGTMVYSVRGFIPIETLNQGQRIWDGENWVKSQGVVPTGKKSVIQIGDLWLTPNHRLLTQEGWRTSAEIALSGDMRPLKLGKYLADGQLLAQNTTSVRNVVSLSVVNAELRKLVGWTPFGGALQRFVADVVKASKVKRGGDPVNTLISSLIHVSASDGVCAGTIFYAAVKNQITRTSRGMVLVGFEWPFNPAEIFWNTLLRCLGGISGGTPWIELIMPKGTVEEISASLHREKTITTEVKECYDVVDSETHSFQAGDFIAHNCGYGMGSDKFLATCLGYGIEVDPGLAERAVKAYRGRFKKVPEFWYDMEDAAKRCVQTGKAFTLRGVTFYREREFLYMRLPSGRCLAYHRPGIDNEGLYYFTEDSQTYTYLKKRTYGGRLVENCIQAIARDILAHGILNVEKAGWPVVLTVHDENVIETGKPDLERISEVMCALPEWAAGCPITAEGFVCDRYRKG
jgi:hypothetical protein